MISRNIMIPKWNASYVSVFLRNWLYFKKTWLVSFFWMVLEPTIYLGAIGLGVGAYVNQVQDQSYLEFFFPALVCSTVMMVAFFENTYGAYTKMTHQKTYETILLTRVGPNEIIAGEALWAASKAFMGGLGVILVSPLFGLPLSYKIILVLPVLFLHGLLFSLIGLIFTSLARSYDSFIYSTSGFIVPMSLLCGTYFPISQMHLELKYFVYLLPLTHSVAAVRSVLSGQFDLGLLAHIVVMLVMTALAGSIAFKRISNKLLN